MLVNNYLHRLCKNTSNTPLLSRLSDATVIPLVLQSNIQRRRVRCATIKRLQQETSMAFALA